MLSKFKIGTRIIAGFGAVLFLMLVIGAFVVISNVGSIDNLKSNSLLSDFKAAAYKVRGSFNSVRADISAYTSSPEAAAPAGLQNKINMLREDTRALNALFEENPALAKYAGQMEVVLSSIIANELSFNEYQGVSTQYHAVAESVTEAVAVMRVTLRAIQDGSAERIREIEAMPTAAMVNNAYVTVGAMNVVLDKFSEFELIVTAMLKSGNYSELDGAIALVDELAGHVSGLLSANAAITDARATAAVGTMVAGVESIKELLEQYRQNGLLFSTTVGKITNETSATLASIAVLDDHLEADMSAMMKETIDAATATLVIVIVIISVAILLAILLAFLILRSITVPLGRMKGVMEEVVSTGNLNFPESRKNELRAIGRGKDELAEVTGAYCAMMDRFVGVSEAMTRISGGDLTDEITLASDSDTIGIAMQKMLANLNSMFSEIQTSSEQVASGSKQIADGAQSLAQGSTEQASAVEQLSASIGEVTLKTKKSAEMANSAANLSENIKNNAQTGTKQMEQMITAVREINEASQSISKVIQVIDNIAFQTNILALNAAVEAARAGQHGRGFAVVAEEVRNLATKSAAAAKDTGHMIENSIEKADLGSRIARQTADSLSEIVEGINESFAIMKDIAVSSEEQAMAIVQINSGIDQVAQVVQQNSATAEESAAASEEMSGQSAILQELIAQFRLKNAAYSGDALEEGFRSAGQLPSASYRAASPGDYGKY